MLKKENLLEAFFDDNKNEVHDNIRRQEVKHLLSPIISFIIEEFNILKQLELIIFI